MIEKIPVLDLQNVQLCFLDNSASGGQISMMNYEGSTFRPLNVFFNIACKKNAQIFCNNFSLIYGKQCVLLQKNNEYSVWMEINQYQTVAVKNNGYAAVGERVTSSSIPSIDKPTTTIGRSQQQQQPLASDTSTPTSVASSSPKNQATNSESLNTRRQQSRSSTLETPKTPLPATDKYSKASDRKNTSSQKNLFSNTQICLLLIQVISDDIEYLMGQRKKIAFQQEISQIFRKFELPDTNKSGVIHYLLSLNIFEAKELPNWREEQVECLFEQLSYLGIKYFGNSSFLDRALDTLQEMPAYQNQRFLDLCMKFVLICKSWEKK